MYRNSEQGAWNTYLTGIQSASTAYLTSYKTAENTYKTAADVADTAYRAASVTAYVGYQNATRDLSALYSTAVARAGDTNFNLAAFFTATGGNTACQAYEFITLQEGNLHLVTPYDPAQIQTPVFSDGSDDSTIQSISDDFQQCWDSLPRKVSTEQKLIDWKMDIFTPNTLDENSLFLGEVQPVKCTQCDGTGLIKTIKTITMGGHPGLGPVQYQEKLLEETPCSCAYVRFNLNGYWGRNVYLYQFEPNYVTAIKCENIAQEMRENLIRCINEENISDEDALMLISQLDDFILKAKYTDNFGNFERDACLKWAYKVGHPWVDDQYENIIKYSYNSWEYIFYAYTTKLINDGYVGGHSTIEVKIGNDKYYFDNGWWGHVFKQIPIFVRQNSK